MNDPAAPILRGILFPHDGDHELLTPDPTEPDGSCAHDWLCAYCNEALNGSAVKQLIRDREDALGGEHRLQELLDRAYDERDEARAEVERLTWAATVSKSAQEQAHALFSLARNHGIPQDEIDAAMLVGCPGCPMHKAGEN